LEQRVFFAAVARPHIGVADAYPDAQFRSRMLPNSSGNWVALRTARHRLALRIGPSPHSAACIGPPDTLSTKLSRSTVDGKPAGLHMGTREWLLLGLLSILWGCSFLFVEVALRGIPVFTVALGRTGIAAAFLLLLLAATRSPLPPLLQRWKEFLVLGALRAAIPICLIVWAQTRIDSGVAGILNSTSPLFTMVIAHLMTSDDRMSPQKLIGCLIGIVGVTVMIGMEFLYEIGSAITGQLAMLGATCSYGFAAVYGRRFDTGSSTASAAGMLSGATLLILPVALVIDPPWTSNPGIYSIGALLGLALLSTAVAFIVWFKLINTAGPSNTSLVTFLIPFTALAFGILLLGEKPSLGSLVGLVIILAGLAVTQLKSSRPSSSVQPTPASGRG
jgi:drug/metabolite transporter (DMT)-like permease